METRQGTKQVRFAGTLPGDLVHRRSLAEVYLTDMVVRDEDTVDVGMQAPRSHAFYWDTVGRRGLHDPMLFTEAVRQTIILLGQEFLGAQLGAKFILREMRMALTRTEALRAGAEPVEAVIRCHVVRRFPGRRGLRGARIRYAVLVEGAEAMTAEISYSWESPAVWDRLRSASRGELGLPAAPGDPVTVREGTPAALVDRRCQENVVIGRPVLTAHGGDAPVAVDTGHPILFDHPLDHVPGMLTLEAFRQLGIVTAVDSGALASPAAVLTGLCVRFTRFIELDLPYRCRARPVAAGLLDDAGSAAVLRCTAKQADRVVAEGEVRLSSVSGTDAPAHARGVLPDPRVHAGSG